MLRKRSLRPVPKDGTQTYPQGDAWKVDLSGKTITKQTMEQARQSGSYDGIESQWVRRSRRFDDVLPVPAFASTLMDIDLSKTAVSDEASTD